MERIQGHMPMGYRMIKGQIKFDPEKAAIVQSIFQKYLDGMSMHQIAREMMEAGVPNANHKSNWSHGTVGKILQNKRYLGDEFYPTLIEQELFDKVQDRRQCVSRELGRIMQPNSYGKRSILFGRLVCGTCGQPYRRYVEHYNQPGQKINWKCKRYIYGNRVSCRNRFLIDEEITAAFIELIRRLTESRTLSGIKNPEKKKPYSREVAEIDRQIQDLENLPEYSTKELVGLIYERAKEQYKVAAINDWDYQTEKLREALRNRKPSEAFDEKLFQAIVKEIIVYSDDRLEFILVNGFNIDIPIESTKERRGTMWFGPEQQT